MSGLMGLYTRQGDKRALDRGAADTEICDTFTDLLWLRDQNGIAVCFLCDLI